MAFQAQKVCKMHTENDIVWIGPDQATPFGNGSRFDAYQYFNKHPEALIAFLEEHTS